MQTTSGFTEQQNAAIRSLPCEDFFYERQGHPYMPPGVAAVLLNAVFGEDGWGMQIISCELVQFPALSADGAKGAEGFIHGPFKDKDKTTLWMAASAHVRLSLGLRDAKGHLTGAQKVIDGVSGHQLAVNNYGNVAQSLGNLRQGAVSRALRAAAQMIGPVFGVRVIKLRKDNQGRTYPWRGWCSKEMPPFPSLPGSDSADIVRDRVERDARQMRAEMADDDEADSHEAAEPRQELAPADWQEPAAAQQPARPAAARTAAAPSAKPTDTAPNITITGERPDGDPPDGKPHFVEWRQTDGSTFGRFAADATVTGAALAKKGHEVRARWRLPADVEYERKPEAQRASAAEHHGHTLPEDLVKTAEAYLREGNGNAEVFARVTGKRPILFARCSEPELRAFVAEVEGAHAAQAGAA